jgi:hypothetical protein
MIDGGRGHGNGRHATHKDAADAGPQQNPLRRQGTGGQDRKLVPAMSLHHPGGLLAESLGHLGTVPDLPRCQPAIKRHSDTCHGLFLPVAFWVATRAA